jgi:SAM-dependent methyltransferase
MSTPSDHAIRQYATTANLAARMAIHSYSTNPQDWFSWLWQRLPLTGDVLEVGAGTGKLWSHAEPSAVAPRLTLVDFSSAMCERLRSVPGAAVLRGDATALPFVDASFDLVIANHMLYHLDDPEAGLREFARVLRPGGRLAAATNGADHLAELSALGPAIGRPDLALGTHRNHFSAEDGPALVARHFTDVSVERRDGDLEVPDAGPVLAYLGSLSDVPLTPQQVRSARDRVRAALDNHGSYRVRVDTVLITGTRPGARRPAT